MKKIHSFKDYVKEHFEDQLYSSLQSYIEANFSSLRIHSYKISNIDEIEVDNIDIKSVRVFDDINWAIKFEIIVGATLLLKGHYHSDGQEDYCEKWFMYSCTGDLSKSLKDFQINWLTEYNNKNNYEAPLTDKLIPYIENDKYEKYATRILKKIYPEALKQPIKIDSEELARRIGLNVLLRTISADGAVFGQIFFKTSEAELYDKENETFFKEIIRAKTILIDEDASFLYSLGTKNTTIVHECVHYLLHSKAFLFARLYDRSLTRFKCLVEGNQKELVVDDKTTSSMEYQANTLAPKILMPYNTFKSKAQELINITKEDTGKSETIDVLEQVIIDLAKFFGVSRLSAKIRMIEVGYEEAVGTFTYIDGRYVKPHKCKKGVISRNQTACISMRDAAMLMLTNSEFNEVCNDGKYIFVDSHFVLNIPEFVEKDENGYLHLTDYARYHIDECCLLFDISLKKDSIKETKYHSICVLNRDIKTQFQYNIEFHNGYEHYPNDKKTAYLLQAIKKEEALFKKMTNDYLECLKIAKDDRGLSFQDIAEEILMDEKTVRRIFKGESDSRIETLVAVCLALHLPPKVSEHIIKLSPLSFNQHEDKHLLYGFALRSLYGHSMKEIRNKLNQFGVQL